MPNPDELRMDDLNPFALILIAEALLRSPLAEATVGNPQGVLVPIRRRDCAGWAGVRITVEAIRPAQAGGIDGN